MNNQKGKIVATIESRMTSSRLPGKVLLEACGKPMLELLIERLQQVKYLEEIVVATTTNRADDPLEQLAKRMQVRCYRGSEKDVLKRVLEAGNSVKADIIVEITGDCPLLDSEISSQIIEMFLVNHCDYASNVDPVSFPIGMDTQVFPLKLLELADAESSLSDDREHVSWFIRRQPGRFRKINLPAPPELKWPTLGLTLDEEKDYRLIKNIFEHFYPKSHFFTCYDILHYLRKHPRFLDINKDVKRNELWKKEQKISSK